MAGSLMMGDYICKRCGCEFKRKDYLATHLKRAKPCDPIYCCISLDVLLQDLQKKPTSFQCSGCQKYFSCKQSHCRHMKTCLHICKSELESINARSNNENDIVHKLIDMNKVLIDKLVTNPPTTNNVVNNINNINITNNTQINSYGNEDTSHVTTSVLDRYALNKAGGLVKLLQHKHFHPKRLMNRNIRVTNLKRPYMQVKSTSGWETKEKNKVLDDLINDGKNMIDEHISDEDTRKRLKNTDLISSARKFIEDINRRLLQERLEAHDRRRLKSLRKDVYTMVLSSTRST
jgi:hypothetical protein